VQHLAYLLASVEADFLSQLRDRAAGGPVGRGGRRRSTMPLLSIAVAGAWLFVCDMR
jgi:hypothetical protein